MLNATGREEKISFLGFDFKYILKPRLYDTDHLIIVFSGFGAKSEFTYDFLKSLSDSSRAAILWIKDDFYNNDYATYYLDIFGEDLLEKAVIGFIKEALEYLSIKTENCTLLGCSKGGASAMYYGIKYKFRNIVATAPTLKIGSYIGGRVPARNPRKSFEFICNSADSEEAITYFDNLILNAIELDRYYDRNIYLLSSEADPYHSGQIKPLIGYLNRYNNFNYIESKSSLVRTHQDVTAFNAPFIISLLNCLSFGMPPLFLSKVISSDDVNKLPNFTMAPVISLRKNFFDLHSRLHLEGIYLIRGIECKEYSDLKYILHLNGDEKISLSMAKGNQPFITKQYYEHSFVNYDKAYFCSKNYEGFDLGHIPSGRYRLDIEIILRTGYSKIETIKCLLSEPILSNNGRYKLITIDGELYIEVANC